MFEKETVTFIDISNIYNHLELTNDEVEAVADYGFSNISFGDAYATLVGNNFALACIIEGLMSHYSYLNTLTDEPSRNLPTRILTKDEISAKFWEVVGENDYINLEF